MRTDSRALTIVQLHNVPLQPGGADSVLDNEAELLRGYGHRVLRFTINNNVLEGMSKVQILKAAFWNKQAVRDLRELIIQEKPDICHVHNTFPIMSPAVIRVAHKMGVPVLQTLHSYRLTCLNGLLFREGAVCEKCVGCRIAWPGIIRGCYKGSRLSSSVIAGALAFHKTIGTYAQCVSAYLALSPFARQMLIRSGYPEERIFIKPNFVHPGLGRGTGDGNYALFIGRFTPEKGGKTVVEAWRRLGDRLPIKIVGDGPMRAELESSAQGLRGISFLGWQSRDEVAKLMQRASLVVFPSQWYEGLPMVILEAYAAGVPVVASDVGNFTDVVIPGKTGLHFRSGDADSLIEQIEGLLARPDDLARMREGAFQEYCQRYSPEANYELYMEIVAHAMETNRATNLRRQTV